MINEELRRKSGKPEPCETVVLKITGDAWRLNSVPDSIKRLESYDDANFYLAANSGGSITSHLADSRGHYEYLLKFYNVVESSNLEMLNGISLLLKTVTNFSAAETPLGFRHPTVPVPVAVDISFRTDSTVATKSDKLYHHKCSIDDVVFLRACNGTTGIINEPIAARLFHWVPGSTLNEIEEITDSTPVLTVSLGYALGSVSNSLRNFDHPSFHRTHSWDLRNFESVAATFSQYIEEHDIRDLVTVVVQRFVSEVIPSSQSFRKSIIMGDCNDANVIVDEGRRSIGGIIDFGDAVYTWSINEVAIAMAYALISNYGRSNPIHCLSCLYGGFKYATDTAESTVGTESSSENNSHLSDGGIEHTSDTADEDHLHTLICVRLCLSIMIGAYSISKDPSNEYLKLHSHPAKNTLRLLLGTSASNGSPSEVPSQSTVSSLFANVSKQCKLMHLNSIKPTGEALAVMFISAADDCCRL